MLITLFLFVVYFFSFISILIFFFFFFNDTATTEIYTLSLHDALPITVRIGYVYPAEYGTTNRFGHDSGDAITGSRTRNEITMFRTWRDLVGAFDERGIGLGGWTFSPQHTYIQLDKLVYRGD